MTRRFHKTSEDAYPTRSFHKTSEDAYPTRQLILTLLLLVLTHSAVAQESWRAGVASHNITPHKLMWMAGYASRDRPAEGKLSDLWAKALVLEDQNGQLGVNNQIVKRGQISSHYRSGMSVGRTDCDLLA